MKKCITNRFKIKAVPFETRWLQQQVNFYSEGETFLVGADKLPSFMPTTGDNLLMTKAIKRWLPVQHHIPLGLSTKSSSGYWKRKLVIILVATSRAVLPCDLEDAAALRNLSFSAKTKASKTKTNSSRLLNGTQPTRVSDATVATSIFYIQSMPIRDY